MDPIDLGRKSNMPETVSPAGESDSKDKMHYPTLYIDGGAELDGLPDEGEMTVKYKKASKTTSERDGESTTCVTLDILQILDAEASEGDEPENEDQSRESALDGLAADEVKKGKAKDSEESDSY